MATSNIVFKVVGGVVNKLFEPELRRLQTVINKLVERNREQMQIPDNWFLYQGKIYMATNIHTAPSGRGSYPSLSMALSRDMDEYTREVKEFEMDKAQITQILFGLLQHCTTLQEVRNTLPEFLVPMSSLLDGLQLWNTGGCAAPQHERFIKQYQKMLPKMEFYAATALFY